MLIQQYLEKISNLISLIENQKETIEQVGNKIAYSIMKNGIVHAFGSGHSAIIAQEISARAGGFVPINKINDPTEGKAERLEGYAKILFDDYSNKYGTQKGEVLLIISNSGRNPLPIEICLEGKERGLNVVAITSLNFSKNVSSRHSSGKKLYELADYVLDTYVEFGDALIHIPEINITTGPGSTIMGSIIVNAIMLKAVEIIIDTGTEPPLLRSMNLDQTDEKNQNIIKKYKNRLNWSL